MIDAGLGSAGFYFNGIGLQYNETDGGFIGWLGNSMRCSWVPTLLMYV